MTTTTIEECLELIKIQREALKEIEKTGTR